MSRIIIMLSLLTILGCSNRSHNYPLSDDDMVHLLSDMLLADELLLKYGGEKKDIYRDSLKMHILKRYELAEPEFDTMMVYLQGDLKYYHEIQKKVSDQLHELSEASKN